jgi:hypothetical protein
METPNESTLDQDSSTMDREQFRLKQEFTDAIAQELEGDGEKPDFTDLDAADLQEVVGLRLVAVDGVVREKLRELSETNSLPDSLSLAFFKKCLLKANVSDTPDGFDRYITPSGNLNESTSTSDGKARELFLFYESLKSRPEIT